MSKTLPSTSYTKRSKPLRNEGNKNRLSHSAMSSRTFSRVQRENYTENDELQKSLIFQDVNDNGSEANEEQHEEELLARLIEQQQQLKELQSRQQKLLHLQKNLAKLDETAESSMSQKLDKLQSARTRIDQLQGLVDNIKSAEQEKSKDVSSSTEREQIVDALGQLNELKNLVDALSTSVNGKEYPSSPSSMSSLKPIFSDHVSMINTTPGKGPHKLPEVTIVKHTREEHTDSVFYQQPVNTPTKIQQVNTFSQQEEQLTENNKELLQEVQRHQILLKELQDRREELDRVMKETEQLKSDTNGTLNNTTNGSVSIKVENTDAEFSMNDPCDFETSDSGRLFGLNESATKRLIDIIRAQKNLDPSGNTEKTTATWGSNDESSESSEDEEDNEEESDSSGDETEEEERDGNDTLALAHESRPTSNLHEIDFRPPTRRQDAPTPSSSSMFSSYEEWKDNLDVLQDELNSAEITMQLLLEDQQALQRLLHNSLNIQNNSFSSKVCYGISPDFLIYQVDNCFNQVISLQNEMRSMQWKLYKIMGNPPNSTKNTIRERDDFRMQLVNAVRSNPITPERSSPRIVARTSKTAPNLAYYDKYARDSPRYTAKVVAEKKGQKKRPTRKLAKPKPPLLDDSCEQEFLDSQGDAKSASSKDNTDQDLFECLRDSIYSEAAILISQNEARPHFLMELFHCLQQIDTDFLRQQCLYNIQDVLKGYITRNQENQPRNDRKQGNTSKKREAPRSMSYSENTPSESAITSDDEIYAKLRAKVAKENTYDYSLKISSGSEVSSPSGEEEPPFASEDLGSTVIHLDAALRHMREMERIKQEQENTGANSSAVRSKAEMMAGDASNMHSFSLIDSKELNSTIKKVISDIIPLLKEERENLVDIKFLAILQSTIIESTLREVKKSDESKHKNKNASLELFFTKQLKTILSKGMLKFVAQRVGSCGEELVLSMSEVLFNELSFYLMMQDMKRGEPIAESKEEDDEDTPLNSSLANNEEDNKKSKKGGDSETELTTQENNEQVDDGKAPVTVDLSASETKPLTSYGSGEDEDEGSGEEYTYNDVDVPTSVQHEQQTTDAQNSPQKTDEAGQNTENTNKEQPTNGEAEADKPSLSEETE